MQLLLLFAPIFFISVAFEFWVGRRRALSLYSVPDAISSLHLGLLSQVAEIFTKFVSIGVYSLVYHQFHFLDFSTESIGMWIAAPIVYDFFYYWDHRFGHRVNLFWASHQVHHSSEYFNLSTAIRRSALGALFSWPFYLPMALFGFPPFAFATVGLIDILYQYWVHTELIGTLGWLDRIFVTPSNHRVHHGKNGRYIDKNFGGILILWDRLFGTYSPELVDLKIRYGTHEPLASFNPVWSNLIGYARIWHALRLAKGWSAKFAVVFGPPNTLDGRNHQVEIAPPAVAAHCQPLKTYSACLYVCGQYTLTALMTLHFLFSAAHLTGAQLAGYAVAILCSAVGVSTLLDGKPYAVWVETVRVGMFSALFIVSPSWFAWPSSFTVKCLAGAYGLASLACLQRAESNA